MKRYYLRLRAESPLSISGHQNLDGQTIPSTDYIPGVTLRGALAWNWLRRQPDARQTPAFRRLFDDAGIHCGPLYPIGGDESTATVATVLPVTARTCKHHQGFITDLDSDPAKVHGVRDSLIALIQETALQRWQEQAKPSTVEMEAQRTQTPGLTVFETCTVTGCDSGMERFGGYYETATGGITRYQRVSVRKRLMTRSQILPTLESTRPGALFSREVIEEGQEFAGWLSLAEDSDHVLESMLAVDEDLYVGAARTAGMGQMRIVDAREDPDLYGDTYGDFAERRQQCEAHLAVELPGVDLAFVPLTLLSDTILLDAHLRHTSSLTPSILTTYAQLERTLATQKQRRPPPPWPGDVQLFCAAAHTRRIASRNTAQSGQRPRSDDWAIGAGSVFVLAAPSAAREALWNACAWLEDEGIGERRSDGFGQIVAAHPFHFAGGGTQCL